MGREVTEMNTRSVKKEARQPLKSLTADINPKEATGINKAPLSCVPIEVVFELGLGMLEGAVKYGRFNYVASGIRASVYYDAAQRHLAAWWSGEDIDDESGLPHEIKLMACMAVLRKARMEGKLIDDRPPRTKNSGWMAKLNKLAGEIIDRHKDKSPRHYTIADTEELRG